MGPEIIFIPSAFKHGITEADIRWAVKTLIGEFLVDEYEDTYAIIGFDTKGIPLEIMYNLINDQLIKVFHAMKCRESFRKKYGIKGEDHG
jgi:orotate phosphoribosyltransferase-like protein